MHAIPRVLGLAAASLLAATSATACPSGERLFHCTLDNARRQLDLCRTGNGVLLLFGPPEGAPEIALAAAAASLALERPEPERARLALEADGFHYRLEVDRPGAGPAGLAARFEILRGGATLAALACDPGGIDLRPALLELSGRGNN